MKDVLTSLKVNVLKSIAGASGTSPSDSVGLRKAPSKSPPSGETWNSPIDRHVRIYGTQYSIYYDIANIMTVRSVP